MGIDLKLGVKLPEIGGGLRGRWRGRRVRTADGGVYFRVPWKISEAVEMARVMSWGTGPL